MAAIEGEFGPLLDVAAIVGDPSRVTLEVLGGSLESWLAAGSGRTLERSHIVECAAHGRLHALVQDAQALLWAYFDTGTEMPESGASGSGPSVRTLPWRDYVGTAMALWGMSADEAWGLTVPEWWAACDAHARAHGAKKHDGPTKLLSREKALEMAAALRAEERAEMQARWRG